MKNIGQYNQDLSVPRKKDIDSLETRIKTNEDNIAMAESDIEGLTTDVGILKTDVTSVKTALNSKQDTVVGAASTIVENNLTAGKVLVSDASGKVGADASISNVSDVIAMNKRLIAQYSILCSDNEKIVELDTDTFSYPAVRFGQNASTKAIKIFGEVEDKVVEFSTESEDFVTLRGVADATGKSDAVNLGQLNKASLNGPITVIFHNIVLKSSKELFPRSWYSCVYTGRIYGFEGSAFIDTSKIKGFVAVGEMSGGYGAGPCSVAYSDGAVTITTLVTMDPTAPNQVKIPCLYWY